jgi:hypothetical protein
VALCLWPSRAFTRRHLAEQRPQKTADQSFGGLKHQLNPGSVAQVLAPGEVDECEKVYVGGWLCEVPSAIIVGRLESGNSSERIYIRMCCIGYLYRDSTLRRVGESVSRMLLYVHCSRRRAWRVCTLCLSSRSWQSPSPGDGFMPPSLHYYISSFSINFRSRI